MVEPSLGKVQQRNLRIFRACPAHIQWIGCGRFVRGPQGRSHSLTERRRGAILKLPLLSVGARGRGRKVLELVAGDPEATPLLAIAPDWCVRFRVAAPFYSWLDGSFMWPP
jgi:hypothetical protein